MAYVKQQLQNTTQYFNRAQFAWFVDSNTQHAYLTLHTIR